jgi:hypothetical protein
VRKTVVAMVKSEAERFLDKIRELEQQGTIHDFAGNPGDRRYDSGHLTAAVKRASMDLTRALVAIRRAP